MVILLAGIAVLLIGALAFRVRWIRPLPDVDLMPALGLLREEDVPPGSGTRLFEQSMRAFPKNQPSVMSVVQDVEAHGWPPPDAEGLERRFDEAKDALDKLQQAAGDAEARMTSLESLGQIRTWMIRALHASNLIVLRLHGHAYAGDWDRATEDLDTGLGMARILDRGGVLIDGLVAAAVRQGLCRAVLSVTGKHAVPEEVREAWIARLLAVPSEIQPLAETLRFEAQAVLGSFDDPDLLDLWIWENPMLEIPERLVPQAKVFVRIRGSSPAGMRRTASAMAQHAVRLAEAPDDVAARAAVDRAVQGWSLWRLLVVEDPLTYFGLSVGDWPHDHARERWRRQELAALATAAALAVQGHEAEHGRLPAELNELVGIRLPAEIWRALPGASQLRLEVGEGTWAIVADPPPGEENPESYRWAPRPAVPREEGIEAQGSADGE